MKIKGVWICFSLTMSFLFYLEEYCLVIIIYPGMKLFQLMPKNSNRQQKADSCLSPAPTEASSSAPQIHKTWQCEPLFSVNNSIFWGSSALLNLQKKPTTPNQQPSGSTGEFQSKMPQRDSSQSLINGSIKGKLSKLL